MWQLSVAERGWSVRKKLNLFLKKKSFMGECSVGAKLDWTDLEKSQRQVCLQTHWRTCRGNRRRPQDCSSLRGSSPSNCKFLMELMISACMSLIIPNTHTHTVRRRKEWGSKGWGDTDKRRKEKGEKKKTWSWEWLNPTVTATFKENAPPQLPKKSTQTAGWLGVQYQEELHALLIHEE